MIADHPVAIVTGGSGGLAPGIVTALAASGMTVVITARDAVRLERAAERLGEAGRVVPISSDALDAASTRQLAADILDRFGRIDMLVNAAASATPISGAIEAVVVDALMADLDTKVGGYLRYIQAVAPTMKAQGRGCIVNIGGLTGRSSDTLSGLRNAAVSHLTKVLSDQLAPHGIAVNAINPGIVRTPHLSELFEDLAHQRGTTAGAIEAEFLADVPARALLDPADIGKTVLFLAQADARMINGESITVDGGYSRGVRL